MKDYYFIQNNLLIFCYNHDIYGKESMLEKLENDQTIRLKGLVLTKDRILNTFENDDVSFFKVGNKVGDYVCLDREVFDIENDFKIEYCLINTKIDNSLFFVYNSNPLRWQSIIKTISDYAKQDCYIVSDDSNKIGVSGFIPFSDYIKLISSFPTYIELKKYKAMRIESIIGDYFNDMDATQQYNNYMNKHYQKIKESSDTLTTHEYDMQKYRCILNKIKDSLNHLEISENQWQDELTKFICLLYPRYVTCLSKVQVVCCSEKSKTKELDCLMVDVEGNCCILELKKPFSDKKLLTNSYRKLFYQPKFELAGGIQQIESYIYDFNLYKKKI